MDEERRKRLHSILGSALELEESERPGFLKAECAGDELLHKRVLELLALASDGDTSFLEPPFSEGGGPASPHRVGDFEILRELGRGGMAVVFLARQPRLEREVALKVLATNAGTAASTIERFHREAQAVAGLRHPGIVQVFADGQAGTTHWFAMEYVEGHDLHTELEIQRGPRRPGSEPNFLPLPGEPDHIPVIARLCRDVAEALHEAHQKGLVHRDVKPGNLLLQPDGRVLVSDFGLVHDESKGTLTDPGALLGTPYYMSPEQAKVQEVKVDHRTDVYSLGVILYELATLRRPYEGKTSADILRKIKDGFPRSLRSINPKIPRDLETICTVAMSPDPEDRYRSAEALAEDLGRFLRHEAIAARPPTMRVRLRRTIRRHRVLLLLLFLASTAGLGGEWLGGLRASERRLGAVEFIADAISLADLEVTVRRLDPQTWLLDDAPALEGAALSPLRLPPGHYRFLVAGPTGRAEFYREVLPSETERVVLRLHGETLRPPGMVLLEAGTLAFEEPGFDVHPLNGKRIELEAFWIDVCEVSNAEYRRFLEATGHAPPPDWERIEPGRSDDLPVAKVSWHDARAYAEWSGKRLPSLAEWTWAARGPQAHPYPWGPEPPEEGHGNLHAPWEGNPTQEEYFLHAVPVRSHPEAKTPTGLFHMLGNVKEFLESPLMEPVGERGFQLRPGFRYVEGQTWAANTRGFDLRGSLGHEGEEETYRRYDLGFRCAKSTN